ATMLARAPSFLSEAWMGGDAGCAVRQALAFPVATSIKMFTVPAALARSTAPGRDTQVPVRLLFAITVQSMNRMWRLRTAVEATVVSSLMLTCPATGASKLS